MATPLATWVVEIDGSSGLAALKSAIDDAGASLAEIDATAKASGAVLSQIAASAAASWGQSLTPEIRKAELELQATERNAEGVAAALGFARDAALPFSDLAATLNQVDEAFRKGAISAEVAHRAIANASRDAADFVKKSEEAKRKAILETKEAADKQAAAIRQAQLGLTVGYGVLMASLTGFIRAGMEGTGEAVRLAQAFQMAYREIANIFAPAINAITVAVEWLRDRLRALTGEQQNTIRNIVATAAAFLFMATIIPRIIGAVQAMQSVLATMAASNPLLLIVAALAAVLAGSEQGREALGNMASAAMGLLDAFTPVFNVLAEIANILVTVMAPILELIASFVKVVLVPVFSLLKPIFELIAFIIKGIAAVANFFLGLFGLGKKDEKKKERSELSPAGASFEAVDQTWKRLQSAAGGDLSMKQREKMVEHLRAIRDATERTRRPEPTPAAIAPAPVAA